MSNKTIATVLGLTIAIAGALGMLAGYIPRLYSGLIAIVAIGIISGARRAARHRTGS